MSQQTHELHQNHEKEALVRINDQPIRVMFQKETIEPSREHRFSVIKLNPTTEQTNI